MYNENPKNLLRRASFCITTPPVFWLTFDIGRGAVASPSLHAIDVADAAAGDEEHLPVAHPQLVGNLEVFPSPDIQAFVVQTDFEEKFLRNSKEAPSHSRGSVGFCDVFLSRLTIVNQGKWR